MRRLVLAAALAALTAVGAVVLLRATGDDAASAPSPGPTRSAPASDPAHTAPAAMRTLVVMRGVEPAPSRPGAVLHGRLVVGQPPAGEAIASVVSDEDCAPDRIGVSHCRNTLRLADGSTFTVRHPHRMSEVPCLTPGERVRVVPA